MFSKFLLYKLGVTWRHFFKGIGIWGLPFFRGRPLMIGGGAEKIEKKNLKGHPPGKKISKAILQVKKNLKGPSSGKKIKTPSARKIFSKIFPLQKKKISRGLL